MAQVIPTEKVLVDLLSETEATAAQVRKVRTIIGQDDWRERLLLWLLFHHNISPGLLGYETEEEDA